MNGIWYHIDGPIEKGSIHILLGWFEQLNPLVQHRIKKKCLPDAPLNEMNSFQKRNFIINIWRVFGAGEWKIHKEPGRLSKGAQNDFKAPFAIEWKPDSNKNQMKWTKLNCSQITNHHFPWCCLAVGETITLFHFKATTRYNQWYITKW